MAQCYQCTADIPLDADPCPGCGAEQSESARDRHVLAAAFQTKLRKWQQTCAAAVLVAFFAGLALGGRSSRADHEARALLAASKAPLAAEQANDIFLRTLENSFAEKGAGLGLLSWLPTPDGIVLEMRPPSPGSPTVWQALNAEERTQLIGFIGVAYTRSLLKAGLRVNLREGHPVVVLTYRGMTTPLAARLKDGKLAVYPSPYDGQTTAPTATSAPPSR